MAGFSFDPNRVAYAEAAGWRAYYDHRWPKMLQLMMELSRQQFQKNRLDLEEKLRRCYWSIQEEMATGIESVELRATSNV